MPLSKNVLIVHAHPDPASLNASLTQVAQETLGGMGHTVEVSDLYRMHWKAAADGDDFLSRADPSRLHYPGESKHAYAEGTQAADIEREQQKLLWADAVIFQFPLWWFSMPAIMKGWVERVFACGFAYGVGQHGGNRWGDRYGEGKLTGKRAMLSITIGGREPHYSRRGVNGFLDDLLFSIHHGILWYPGMGVLPPFALYQADRLGREGFEAARSSYQKRLEGLFTDSCIPFRTQNGGHYDDSQVLKSGFADGQSGLSIHQIQPGEPEPSPL